MTVQDLTFRGRAGIRAQASVPLDQEVPTPLTSATLGAHPFQQQAFEIFQIQSSKSGILQ